MAYETGGNTNQDTGTRDFHIGDILSITTGRLVSPRHIEGVYDILDYMTGDDLTTIALPRAAEECAPYLLEQHPDLASVEVPETLSGMNQVKSWLGGVALQYGETRPVAPLPAAAHESLNPFEELARMGYAGRVVEVQVAEEEE